MTTARAERARELIERNATRFGVALELVEKGPGRTYSPEERRYVYGDGAGEVVTSLRAIRVKQWVDPEGRSLVRVLVPDAARADGTAIEWRPGMNVRLAGEALQVHAIPELYPVDDAIVGSNLDLRRP